MSQRFFLCLIALLASLNVAAIENCSIDLEDRIQDFVLYTKQIEVPGYPDAYNPSIIRWNGQLLMSFRNTPDPKQKYNSEIGVVRLDEKFNAISEPQILDLRPSHVSPNIPSRAEDGRLIIVGETLYLIYDDCCDPIISRKGFRVYVAELDIIDDLIFPTKIEALLYFEGESSNIREKGWTPFDYNNQLFLIYSIAPNRVFEYLQGSQGCAAFAESVPSIYWEWGILRGGTAAAKMDSFYLSFFHSSVNMTTVHSGGKEALHYFMGAYTFSSKPPFQLLSISPMPIIGKNFYHGKTYKPYHHPVCAIFPAGYICNHDKIFVFYGRQDHEIWVVALNKKGLLNSLKPVTSYELFPN
jgi:predicted GH43/DUF377 family glycosyl hydrolase